MRHYALSIQKRTITGRKTKKLRAQNILPANIFGKNMQSLVVQMPTPDFLKVYQDAGETGLIDLKLAGESRSVLIQNVQIHPVTQQLMHVDFYQVDLKEKVKTSVPVELVGNAPAVEQRLGVLLEFVDKLEVECLPTNIPEKFLIEINKLTQVGDAIKVSQIPVPNNVTILTDPKTDIVKIGELISKEAEALVQEEAIAQAAQTTEVVTETQPATPTATNQTSTLAETLKSEKK